MAYDALNNLIDAYIYRNGIQAITGQILNGVLKQMVAQLGGGYNLMGVAVPATTPATNDEPLAYFAATAGTYTDFGGITLAAGEIAILQTSGDGTWVKQTIYNVPTGTADLENTANYITNAVTDLVNYYTKTEIDELPNGEDIDFDEDGKLQFANRTYNSLQPNGMGYKILRKDATFASQVSDTNTIYEIRYDFDLNGASVTIPAGSCIKLVGGRINNGTLVLSSNVSVFSESSNGASNYNLTLLANANNLSNISIRDLIFTGDKTNDWAIGVSTYAYVNGMTIKNCTISGYAAGGIRMYGRNTLYDGNLIYNCGTADNREHCTDLAVGYTAISEFEKTPNIIITNNRLLSNNVDRHIDVGELYSETNIIINGNTCVAMTDDLSAEYPNALNRHGIMVGYAGISENEDRYAIISNNVVKYGTWSGIYVRAANNAENVGKSKYKVIISSNIIFGVTNDPATMVGAIGCELKAGSIISSNIIDNCTIGMDLGAMYADADVLVVDNTIKVTNVGLRIESFCRRLKVSNNQIVSSNSSGISVSPVSTSQTEDIYNGKIDISGNNIDSYEHGIQLYNVSCRSCRIDGNTIFSEQVVSDKYGILCQSGISTFRCVISNNIVRNKTIGIRVLRSAYREGRYNIHGNSLYSCTTGISAQNGNSAYLLPVYNNRYEDCTTKLGTGLYDGFYVQEGTAVIYDYLGFPWAQGKQYLRGDLVFARYVTNGEYNCARCMQATSLDGNGVPVDNSALWYVEGLMLYTSSRQNIQANLWRGTKCYDRDLKKEVLWNGTAWTNVDGTALS